MNTIKIYDSFDDLSAASAALFDASGAGSVFLTRPWFDCLRTAGMAAGVSPRIFAVESGGAATLALPMAHAPAPSAWAPRTLMAYANYYTSLFGPVGGDARGEEEVGEDVRRLARAIAADTPRWDRVDLHPMAREGPLFEAWLRAFREAGMAVQPYFCFGNWTLDVGGRTYDEYAETLPSKLRNTIRRKSAQLMKAGRLHLTIAQHDDAALPAAISAYQRIYAASWKSPEPHPGFMPSLIATCARHGWLRLGVAYIDGEPAAAQLWIVRNGVASIYKLAYDERHAGLSIGSILTSHLMRHALDVDRVHEVDYLTGDEAYKRDWMSHRRERWGITAFHLRTWRGALSAGRHLGGHALKRLAGR